MVKRCFCGGYISTSNSKSNWVWFKQHSRPARARTAKCGRVFIHGPLHGPKKTLIHWIQATAAID